jgi:deoxyribose-phosphate aldolase
MILEICCVSHHINYKEIVEAAHLATSHSFDSFCVPVGYAFKARPYLKEVETLTKFGSLINYPYGNDSIPLKLHAILESTKQNCDIVDVVINHTYLTNNDKKNFFNDLNTCSTLAHTNKIEIRFIVDYKLFSIQDFVAICSLIRQKTGITTIISSSGVFADDPNENIIACEAVQKIGINTICYSQLLNKRHLPLLRSAGIYGARFNYSKQAENIL